MPATFVVDSIANSGAGTLRNQIIAANAAAGADEITFDASVFNVPMPILLASEIAITGSLTISGPAQALTISGNSSGRIFNIDDAVTGTAIVVNINDVTLTKGVTSGAADGAAIFIQDENVTLTRCTLTANSSSSDGGAIRLEATGGKLTLDTCVVSSNTAASIGGGISAANAPTVSVFDTTFSNNTGSSSGAISMLAGGTLLLDGSTFNGNSATSGDGGAVFLNGTLTSPTVRNCTFSANVASSDAGAIGLGSSSAGTLTVQSSTFASNGATAGNGGAIARTGGAATVSLVSTIVFSNTAGTTADNLFTTGTLNATLCVIGNTTGVTTFNGDTFTDTNIGVNPGLGSLQNNGGPTQTRGINSSSIAFDAGSNPAGLATDQRGTGYFRVRGKAADIGAFEVPDDFTVTNTNNSGTGSLRQAVLDANNAIGIDTIVFDSTVFAAAKTITLTSGELLITESLTIDGPTAALTVSGNNNSRVFHIENVASIAQAFLNDLTLTAGKAAGGDGGALLSTEPTFLTNVNVTNSSAGDEGGAIRIATPGTLTLDTSTISGNSAVTGGGLTIDAGVSATIKNATFSTNVATGFGGGIAVLGSSPFSLTHVTLSGNTAATGGGAAWTVTSNNNGFNNSTVTGNVATGGKGGGVYAKAGTITFTSTIVSGNTGVSGPDIFSTATTTVTNSAVGSDTGFTFSGSSANNLAAGTNLLLGPLASNGGPAKTHLPGVNSPVLGKGSNITSAVNDQRGSGFPRSRGGSVDIGAVEVPQFVVLNTNASGAGSLLQATIDANAASGADTITFDASVFTSSKTIIPTATMTLTDSTSILAPATKVIVSGNLARRIVDITGGSTFTFSNLSLTLGSAAGNGGAVLVNAAGNTNVDFLSCNLSFNQCTAAGGAVSASNDDLTFTDCTLSSNDTTGASQDGGAIHLDGSGSVTLTRSTVANNQATGDGGGIALNSGSTDFLMVDSTISSNSAGGTGGGLFANGGITSGGFIVRNSTLSDNTAVSFGGGIAWNNTTGSMTIQNSTITLNSSNAAAGGGGISIINVNAGAILNLESTIVSGNINAGAPDIDNPNTTNQKTSAVGSNLGYAKTDQGGNLAFGAALLLGPLASNTGPTLNHLPGTGSPLINAGSNPVPLTFDQRGFPRSLGGAPDIGSAEFLNTVVKNTNDSGVDSLRQIILDTNGSPGSQTITFDATKFASPQTIKLTTGELLITDDTTVTGPVVGVTVSGNDASRVFNIDSPTAITVNISDLTMTAGLGLAGSGRGGAVLIADETVSLTRCAVTNSHAIYGGGIGIKAGSLTLTNCTVTGNDGSSSGGGIYSYNGGIIVIQGSTINGNSAFGPGAGIRQGNSNMTVIDSTISNNSSNISVGDGGGIAVLSNGSLTVRNSTISGNTGRDGGGIAATPGFTGIILVQNSTVAQNSAFGTGGGIGNVAATGTITIASSIVFGNTAPSGPQIAGPSATVNTSLVGSKSGVTTFNGDTFTNANIGVDPQLGALANNGGPTLTHLPAATSPARNNGFDASGSLTDQRGFTRISGGVCDIGSVEMSEYTVVNTNNTGIGSLRQAVLDANAAATPEAVITFSPANFATSKIITLTTGGELAITHGMTIVGPSVGVTVSGNNASRIFNINGTSTLAVAISDMTLTKGLATGTLEGGAIETSNDVVTLTRVNVSSSSAKSGGGGVDVGSGGKLTLNACTITGNSSSAGPGGGIRTTGSTYAAVFVNDSTISNNTAVTGAGISALSGGNAVVVNSTISGNSAVGGAGGGIAIDSTNSLTIRNSTLSGNSASFNGGAIANAAGSTSAILIQNSTIANNTATASGGGIFRAAVGSSLTITSTIVSGNSGASNVDISGGSPVVNFSAIGSGAGFSLGFGSANNLTFGSNLKLGALSNNGGTTFTHLPAVDSPVVNAGSNPASHANDQRGSGFLRTFGGGVDIGAVESKAIIVSNTNDSGVGSLRQSILDANAQTGADTITFDPAVFAAVQTITLTSGELALTDSVTVTGPTSGVTVSGNDLSRIFFVNEIVPVNLLLSNLTLMKAKSGAVFYSADGGTLSLSNCTLTQNTSTSFGGALTLVGSGTFTATDCKFTSNSGKFGGAIDFTLFADYASTFLRCEISGNTAASGGGAYFQGSAITIDSCTISNNQATGTSASLGGGGGIRFNANSTNPAIIRNSTISGNSTAFDGGGIDLTNFDGTITVQNSTIANNTSATSGGGIARTSGTGTIGIESTIVFGNAAPTGPQMFTTGTATVTTSLVGSKSGVTTFTPDAFTLANLGFDPLLGPLQNNGGVTLTHMPANASKAAGNGSNPATLTTDQRGAGFPRALGAVDIGAVETPVLIVTNTNDSGAGSLRQAVLDANAAAGANVILFDTAIFAAPQTITLSSGEMAITDSVTITGPAVGVTVNAFDLSRIFNINGTGTLSVAISDMTLTNASAISSGGAILIADEAVTLNRVTISSASIPSGQGGGISITDGSLTLTNSAILGNQAPSAGGIFSGGKTNLTIINSTLSANSVNNFGGALAIGNDATGSVLIQNTTITANTAGNAGGGIRNVAPTGTMTITIASSIVSGNSATSFADISSTTITPVVTFSAIGSNLGFGLGAGSGNNLAFGTSLKLAALASNGGPTQTHLPANDSPLINVGSNPASLTTDQRGVVRVIGGQADIGAVEVQNLIVFNTNNSGTGSLRQTITDANTLAGANTITFDPTAFATAKTITLTSGELLITDSTTITGPSGGVTVSGNSASRVVNIDGAAALTVSMSNLTVRDGKTTDSNGGAGILASNDFVTLTNCILTNNSLLGAGSGGGISVNANATGPASLSLAGCTVSSNLGPTNGGGVSIIANSITLTIVDSTISGNTSTGDGGGVIATNIGNVTIRNSTISGNTSTFGNGGGVYLSNNTALLVQNSTIVGNSAFGSGGGIARGATTATTLESSIISGNLASTGPDLLLPGTLNVNTSLIGSKSGVTTFNGDAFTNANIGVNPQLGELQNNGGPTLTHLPAANSRAVNNGSDPASLTTDQRGFTRIINGAIDIGAVETRSFLVTNTNNSGAGSLRQAVSDTNSFAGADTIAFDPTVFATAKTISLLTALPSLSDAVTLQGTGANLLTIRRDPSAGSFRVFVILNSAVNVTIADTTISGGSGSIGAGVSTSATTLLDRVAITGNTSPTSNGGGVIALSTTLTVRDSTISGNSAADFGGGIHMISSFVTIERSTLSGNTAGIAGGGIGSNNTGSITLLNSTVSGNSANTAGGIDINTFTGPVTIHNTTISANSANTSSTAGLRIVLGAPVVELRSSIVSANSSNARDISSSFPISMGTSAIGTTGAFAFTDLGGNLPFGTDLRLAPLANNGGPTQTHALLNGSPAINAGSNPDSFATDQRGSARVTGTSADIGAFEFQGVNFIVNGGAIQRSRLTTIQVNFPTPVNAATLTGLDAITLTRTTAILGGSVGTVVKTGATGANGRILVTPTSGTVHSVTLTFDNADGSPVTDGVESASLADGRWQLAIPSLSFTSTLNDPDLRRLFGDSDGNGTVDGAIDFPAFGAAFNVTAPNSPFDFDNNGNVDGAIDFPAFGAHFNVTL